MNKTEAYEFLELNEGANLEAIRKQWQEKFNHFQNIFTNAPTPQLKSIHKLNLEKLEQIKALLLESQPQPPLQSAAKSTKDTPIFSHETKLKQENIHIKAENLSDPSAAAFLIRHTEGKDSKVYSLAIGKNPIGRQGVDGLSSVVIDDDPYVSRYHAVLNIYKKEGAVYFEISDNGEYSQGKKSKNGTFVNAAEQRIEKPVLLREQDTIQIGITKLMLKANTKPLETIVKDVRRTERMKTVLIADLL